MKNLNLCGFAACLMLAALSCTSQTPKTEALQSSGAAKLENRFSDGVVGTHDVAILNDLLADNFVSHHFPAPGNNNKAAFTGGMTGLFAGFPDIKVTRLQQYEQGDKVFTYAFWEATHTGTFMGIPPTGKKVHVEYMDIWRAENGKIAENWVVMDIMGLMIQLGVVPPPGATK
ncbi:MAG: ester cyclase [Saprospiraceae bacterium]